MKKSPVISALLNMLVPGSSYLYTEKRWKKAIVELITGIVLWVLCYFLVRSWNAPFVYLIIPVLFFIDGWTVAKNYNAQL